MRYSRKSALRTSPNILLLNKIDTEEGRNQYPVWRAFYPSAVPISARTGEGMAQLHEAVHNYVRGQQVEVEIEVHAGNGKLLAFLQSQCRIENQEFIDDKVRMTVVVGKNFLRDLGDNDDVTIISKHGKASA